MSEPIKVKISDGGNVTLWLFFIMISLWSCCSSLDNIDKKLDRIIERAK